MKIVSLFNEQVNFLFVGVSKRENVVNITFPFSRFCFALAYYFFFWQCKCNCHFGTHHGTIWVWRKFFAQNRKEFSWSVRSSISFRYRDGMGGLYASEILFALITIFIIINQNFVARLNSRIFSKSV